MKKVYKMHGVNSACLKFRLGNGELTAKFDDGIKGEKPATYTTDKPLAQLAIEESPYFGTKVFLDKVYDDSGNLVGNERRSQKPKNDTTKAKPLEDVTDINGAREYLVSIGVKSSTLRSRESILELAAKNGVSFPNLEN